MMPNLTEDKNMNKILMMSGVELAKKIREGELTSTEVVATHIEHIKKVNPKINAVVKDRFAQALAEAKIADEKAKNTPPEQLPIFHGVPCTIKEAFALAGMPNTSGLVAQKGAIAKYDATTVARLKSAGAIPLGVTNTSELCMWMESYNKVYGRTNNPYNIRRTAGGSSGGEGAIIGAGGSPFGLGSDIGGSIRMPAFFNGVFGHKPSSGLIPNTGQYPAPAKGLLRYLTPGPLARRAEDLFPLIKILAGPDGEDDSCKQMELGDPSSVKISELSVLVVEDNGAISVKPDVLKALHNAASALAKAGAKVTKCKIEGLKKSFSIWSSALSEAGGPSFSELLGNGKPIASFKELVKLVFGKSQYTLPAVALTILERVPKLMPNRTKKLVEAGKALKQELTEMIGPNGIVLYPSYPSVAPPHNKPILSPFNWVYTAIWNIMEFPVTQVPLGLNDEGLPLGVQVISIYGNDHVTIAVALELEKIFGGWVPPKFD